MTAPEKVWWHSHDHHSPNLSKASLGEFFHAVLSVGADVGQVWAFNHKYPRSSVFISIKATVEQKDQIEAMTRYRFRPPPKVHLSQAEQALPEEQAHGLGAGRAAS